MAKLIFSNRASSLLAASIDDDDTVVQVSSGEGALFPSPGANEYFVLALVNDSGDLELCHCTSRTGDLLTVTRAQEGTTAQSWVNGATRAELRLTAGVMNAFLQKPGDTMAGPLNMGGNDIENARIDQPVIEGGQLVGTAMRGAEDDSSNELVVPSDGSRATAGGAPIMTQNDAVMTYMPVGAVMMWYGNPASLPTGWAICNGSNGTPDMRGLFPIGAGGDYNLGATGGSATASGETGSAGAHTHSVSVQGAALTAAQLPAHSHRVLARNTGGGIGDCDIANANGERTVLGGFRQVTTSKYILNTHLGEQVVENTGSGQTHTHSASTGSDGAHTHDLSTIATVPPYRALYFIMKVS